MLTRRLCPNAPVPVLRVCRTAAATATPATPDSGIVDGVYFKNITIGNITYCGSSRFVFTPPHSAKDQCTPRSAGAQMLDIGMGYVGAPTNPGRVRNVVFDGLHGIGPTGNMLGAHGLASGGSSGCPGCVEHIVNLTLKNIDLQQGNGVWGCDLVDGVVVESVKPWSPKSTCPHSNREP